MVDQTGIPVLSLPLPDEVDGRGKCLARVAELADALA